MTWRGGKICNFSIFFKIYPNESGRRRGTTGERREKRKIIHYNRILRLANGFVHVGNTRQFLERRFAILNSEKMFHCSIPFHMALRVIS